MRILTLDIETVGARRFIEGKRELCPRWLEEHPEGESFEGEAPLRGTGRAPALHPTTCHIVSISYGWRRTADGEIATQVDQWDNRGFPEALEDGNPEVPERLIVGAALRRIAGCVSRGNTLVTFNGKGFDLPCLRWRAALLRVDAPAIRWGGNRGLLYPFNAHPHCDLRLELSSGNRRAHGTLAWWTAAFGVHSEEQGAHVGEMVKAGDWEGLRRYGEVEATTLIELYEAAQGVIA